jgi:hypothetical protein
MICSLSLVVIRSILEKLRSADELALASGSALAPYLSFHDSYPNRIWRMILPHIQASSEISLPASLILFSQLHVRVCAAPASPPANLVLPPLTTALQMEDAHEKIATVCRRHLQSLSVETVFRPWLSPGRWPRAVMSATSSEEDHELTSSEKTNVELGLSTVYNFKLLCRTYLEMGADPNSCSNWHEAPIHTAARSATGDVIRLLIDRGADLDLRMQERKQSDALKEYIMGLIYDRNDNDLTTRREDITTAAASLSYTLQLDPDRRDLDRVIAAKELKCHLWSYSVIF